MSYQPCRIGRAYWGGIDGHWPARPGRREVSSRSHYAVWYPGGRGPAVIVAMQLPELAAEGLAAWAERTGRHRAARPDNGGLRFVFYGRVSTEDYQEAAAQRGSTQRSKNR